MKNGANSRYSNLLLSSPFLCQKEKQHRNDSKNHGKPLKIHNNKNLSPTPITPHILPSLINPANGGARAERSVGWQRQSG